MCELPEGWVILPEGWVILPEGWVILLGNVWKLSKMLVKLQFLENYPRAG